MRAGRRHLDERRTPNEEAALAEQVVELVVSADPGPVDRVAVPLAYCPLSRADAIRPRSLETTEFL